jgi:non-ribosomal peptide synthetase component F
MPAERDLVAAIRTGRGDAIIEAGSPTSYPTLLDEAGRLATALRRRGAGPGAVVPVQGTACAATVTQIVAVLLTGAAYAPLDSRTPDLAVSAFARLCGSSVVLGTRSHIAHGVHWLTGAGVAGDSGGPAWVSPTVPEGTAYVIATSGTSGAPKGVVVPDSAVAAYLGWAMADYGVREGYGAPLFTSLGFDLTVTSLLGPLVSGRRIVVLDPVRWPLDVATDPRLFDDAGFVKMTPSQLDILCQVMSGMSARSTVATVVVGGEALRGSHVARWRAALPAARVVNEYGPSEAAVGCCVHTVPDGFADADVPIGAPPPGVVLDLVALPAGYTVPAGTGDQHGELIIEGDQVATGYLVAGGDGRGTVTPFAAPRGTRRFHSGDHVSRGPDGLLTYHGRIGREVKLNGFRVNMSALESRLAACPGVVNAAVAYADGELTARVVATDPDVTPKALRRHLLELFPVYALPTDLAVSHEITVTERGKFAAARPSAQPESW